jgi:hypothetical protein
MPVGTVVECSPARNFSRAFRTRPGGAGIAAVEEAPGGARAFATAMRRFLGVGIAGNLPPFADLGNYGWRISFSRAPALFFCLSGDSCRNAALHDARRAVGAAADSQVFAAHVSRDSCSAGGVCHERLHRAVVTVTNRY